MTEALHILDIHGVRKHFQIPDHDGLSDDFFLMKTEVDKNLLLFRYPCRFDGFVVVVKHWRLNNYIRKDTYHETKYKEFMRELYFDENQSYSMNHGDGHVPCLPQSSPAPVTAPSQPSNEPVTAPSRTRDEPLTQDSIGKDSIDKSIVSTGEVRKGEKE